MLARRIASVNLASDVLVYCGFLAVGQASACRHRRPGGLRYIRGTAAIPLRGTQPRRLKSAAPGDPALRLVVVEAAYFRAWSDRPPPYSSSASRSSGCSGDSFGFAQDRLQVARPSWASRSGVCPAPDSFAAMVVAPSGVSSALRMTAGAPRARLSVRGTPPTEVGGSGGPGAASGGGRCRVLQCAVAPGRASRSGVCPSPDSFAAMVVARQGRRRRSE